MNARALELKTITPLHANSDDGRSSSKQMSGLISQLFGVAHLGAYVFLAARLLWKEGYS